MELNRGSDDITRPLKRIVLCTGDAYTPARFWRYIVVKKGEVQRFLDKGWCRCLFEIIIPITGTDKFLKWNPTTEILKPWRKNAIQHGRA